MAHVLGLNAKLYRNTGSYASPTWDIVPNVKDLTLNLEAGEADITTRGSLGSRERAPTLRDASVETSMVWDNTEVDFQAFLDAFTGSTALELLVLDGLTTVPGSEGLRAKMGVFSFTREEPLEEALMANVSLKPVRNADSPPAWYIQA